MTVKQQTVRCLTFVISTDPVISGKYGRSTTYRPKNREITPHISDFDEDAGIRTRLFRPAVNAMTLLAPSDRSFFFILSQAGKLTATSKPVSY